jgi:pSer/pThr/pTyr-binding forkhead associated (FHA) protein
VSELAVAHTFEVTTAGATIGRGPDNSVRLSDLSVSRRHARVVYRQAAYWLSDVGSMGGTWIDGTKLAAARRLEPGQVIDIGVCRFTVAGPPSASSEDDRPMTRPATSAQTRRQ